MIVDDSHMKRATIHTNSSIGTGCFGRGDLSPQLPGPFTSTPRRAIASLRSRRALALSCWLDVRYACELCNCSCDVNPAAARYSCDVAAAGRHSAAFAAVFGFESSRHHRGAVRAHRPGGQTAIVLCQLWMQVLCCSVCADGSVLTGSE